MKKQAKEIKKEDIILIAGKKCVVQDIELSSLGKHGKRKVRIVAQTPSNEKIVVIRPEDFPFEVLK